MKIIEETRNKMKLILQNSEIKSEEYKKVIKMLKKGDWKNGRWNSGQVRRNL